MELIHVAILTAVIFQAQCSVSVDERSVEVRPGDEANLSCRSSNIAACIFNSPSGETLFMKRGINHENGRITYSGEDESTDCSVRITNIEEKDNGIWKCILTTVSGETRTVEEAVSVIVSKAPVSVRLEVDGQNVGQTMVVNFRETNSKQVSCISERARPAATFTWMLGEDRFDGNVRDLEAQPHEDGSVTQTQVLNYEAKPSHNGKSLICIVNHNGFSTEERNTNKNMAAVDLDVQFQPVAADHPQAFYNLIIGETKEIVMSFRAHPAPTEVYWNMHDNSEVAQAGESLNKRFRAEILKENSPNPGQFTAKLIINEVMEKDAGTTNTLTVTNELGTTKYPFTLSLGDKPASASAVSEGGKGATSAGTGPVIAIIIVAIIIIVVIVVAVIARSQGMLCFADKNSEEDGKKSAAQFEALEKGDELPEKEPIKESSNDIKPKEPVTETVNEQKPETVDEKKTSSNGNHTPV